MLCGIFVGGRARRMGGIAKGLLRAPDGDETLVVRLARLAGELGLEPVLVGDDARYRAALPALRVVRDQPAGIGPLGGLMGLLREGDAALALACDLPFVSRSLLERLAQRASPAAVLAPREAEGLWQPLCARYDAATVRPVLAQAIAHGTRSFQRLFAELAVEELPLSEIERRELHDWDTPEDVAR